MTSPLVRRTASGLFALTLVAAPLTATAQGTAMAEARTRLVCGSGTVVSANYIPGGLLQATCRANTPQQANNPSNSGSSTGGTPSTTGLGTGGLGGTAIGATVVATGVVLGVVGNSSTSTTTTSLNSGPVYD